MRPRRIGLAALFTWLDLFLTTDSGPAHVAYAVGARGVTVFLASEPDRWGPPASGPHTAVDARRHRDPADVTDLVVRHARAALDHLVGHA